MLHWQLLLFQYCNHVVRYLKLFWSCFHGRIPTPKNVFIKGFDHFTITAYFSLLFNALENGFRSFYKSIFPSKTIPGFFFYVYKEILEDRIMSKGLCINCLLSRIWFHLIRHSCIHFKIFSPPSQSTYPFCSKGVIQ